MKEGDWIHWKAQKSNSSQHWNTYRKVRNKVNCLVKSAKMKYYCGLFQDAKGNAKKKFGMQSMKFVIASESVQCIISNGIQHTTPKSIASAVNSFFMSIGKRLAYKITTTWLSCNSSTNLLKSQFQLVELEESFVPQQLLAVKTNKVISWTKLVQDCSKTLLIRLHYLLLSYWIYQLKLVNVLNCGNVLKLQPCLSQGTGQMDQTTDLSLFCLHSGRFLRELYIHSYTSSRLFFTVSNTTKMPHRRAVLKVGQNESIIQL